MDAHSQALNFFTEPGLNSAITQTQFIDHLPITQVTDSGFAEFMITSPDFIDLSRSYISVKCKVVCGDDSDIKKIVSEATFDKKGDIYPTNNLLHGLFDRVDFTLQDKTLTNDIPSHSYPFKAMIDTLMTATSEEDMATLFVKDPSDAIDSCSVYKKLAANPDNEKASSSLKTRYKMITESREFEMLGRLNIDFWKQKKYLLNNVNINLRLWRTQPEFALLSASTDVNHKIKLSSIKLVLCHVKLTPDVVLAINDSAKVKPISYPYDRSIIKNYSIASGLQTVTLNDIFTGKCPDKIMIAMNTTKRYLGSLQSNQYMFDHFKLSEIGFYLDNTPLPGKALSLKFGDDAFDSSYIEAWERLRKHLPTNTILSYSDFFRGYSIFLIDLTNEENGDLFPAPRQGQTRLELRFDKALSESINILIYGSSKATFTLDHVRNATLDD